MRAHLTQRPHGPLIGRLLAGAALLLLPVASAEASNNFTLQRFGTCERLGSTGNCLGTSVKEKEFRSFAGQLGEVMTIKGVAPADTPGVAGFVFQIDRSFNDFDVKTDGAENPWVLAHKTGKPKASMGTTQIHVRKGSPSASRWEPSSRCSTTATSWPLAWRASGRFTKTSSGRSPISPSTAA